MASAGQIGGDAPTERPGPTGQHDLHKAIQWGGDLAGRA
jgi:hypothetical protein